MKIGEVYGHSGNKLLKSISTSGKSMYIKFRKEFSYGSVKTEFKASIKYKKINFDCQTWLDIDKNILMSPNHPINSNCSWLITSKFGTFIRLDFKFIEVDYYFWVPFFCKVCLNGLTFMSFWNSSQSEESSWKSALSKLWGKFFVNNSLYSIFNLNEQLSNKKQNKDTHIFILLSVHLYICLSIHTNIFRCL